jgi:hypothetical protein
MATCRSAGPRSSKWDERSAGRFLERGFPGSIGSSSRARRRAALPPARRRGLLWTARRIFARAGTRLPTDPEWDEEGLRMEFVR